ncbi:MAG TPA: sugar efflux transporter [Opitutaceae bacterium]|nr:sugar efflux transporter [Opitutaceae bacterium]
MRGFASRLPLILKQPGFAGLLVSAFALGVGLSFVGPFLSLWGTREIGMRPATFGAFMTVTALSATLVATLLARWSDTHLPRKVMLVMGACGGVLGYTGYALLHDVRFLVGVGSTVLALAALCFAQLFAYTRERFHDAEVPGMPPGFMVSVVRVCFSLAWTAGPSIGAWIMVGFGFRGLFLGAALLFLIFLVGVLVFVPFERRPPNVRAAIREPVWRILTRGDLFAVFFAFLLVFAAHAMNALNLPLLIMNVLGGKTRDLGITYGVGPIAEVPLMLYFGHLAGRGHQLAIIRFGAIVTTAYFLVLSEAHAPWHVYLAQILSGASFAIISNVAIVFFQDLVPGQPGLATTVFSNAAYIGNLVGYLGFGALVGPLGNRGVILVSAALTLGMMVILFLYRPRRDRGSAMPVLRAPVPLGAD